MLRIAPKTCAWRKSRIHVINEFIEGMSEKNPKELVEPLWVFMFEVAKHKGDLYPTLSLRNLLRAIGRVIR